MAQLEKDVELLETAIEDIEEEIEEIIEGIDYEGDDQVTAKVDRAKTQLRFVNAPSALQLTLCSELLDLIKNMKKENREIRALSAEDKKKSRAAMLEDIDRLKEELDAMQVCLRVCII